jgi:hypothetical protein
MLAFNHLMQTKQLTVLEMRCLWREAFEYDDASCMIRRNPGKSSAWLCHAPPNGKPVVLQTHRGFVIHGTPELLQQLGGNVEQHVFNKEMPFLFGECNF